MKKNATIIAALILASVVAGCGNFSNDDIVFLASLPDPEHLALRVPGTESSGNSSKNSLSQSLAACSEDNLRCNAGDVSTSINAVVFGVLNVVDGIAYQHAPSYREPNYRLWGPVYLADENLSVRFEIRRFPGNPDAEFEYCLHATRGKAKLNLADDIACDMAEDDSGLVRLLWGVYTPGEVGGGARDGRGSLEFDLNAARRAGLGKPEDKGRIIVDYSMQDKDLRISVRIRDVMDERTLLPASADYLYVEHPDTSGEFRFVVRANFAEGFLGSMLEQLDISAQWSACQAGRADASISGGDLGESVIQATQCWGCAGDTTYYQDSGEEHPTQGDISACVFDASLIP